MGMLKEFKEIEKAFKLFCNKADRFIYAAYTDNLNKNKKQQKRALK
jgi:hypothetical protein